MKKVLGLFLTGILLASCSSNVDEEQLSEAELPELALNEEGLLDVDSTEAGRISFGADELLSIYAEKPSTPLAVGLYKNQTVIDGNLVDMAIIIDMDTITKTSVMKGFGKEFEGSAKYSYSGNVIKYEDVKGDAFLFNPQGDAFIKTKDGFSLVEICDATLQKVIPSSASGIESDTYCDEGIMLSIFSKETI